MVPIAIWSVYKFVPSVENAIYPLLNCMVHVVMYLYYTLASFGPQMEPYLRWKKYLTIAQLVQFIAIILHSIRAPFIGCAIGSTYFMFISTIMGGIFFYLFYEFYLENYCQNTINYKSCSNARNNNKCFCEVCLNTSSIDTVTKYQQLIS